VLNGWGFTRKKLRDGVTETGMMLHEGMEATGEIVKKGGRDIASKISRRRRL
jgi:hypothetical protein